MSEPIRIANCSGFYGDRLAAAREMVEGGPIDVLTGDWLAELTMLILSRIRAKRPGAGFARTFVDQMEQVMGTCLDRGIKVVSNAGGLDPGGCAEAVSEVAARLGLAPTIAFVDGDDLMPRLPDLLASGALRPFTPQPVNPRLRRDFAPTGAEIRDANDDFGESAERFLTANAYLGCFGIVDALDRGADIVITGRVTDAAVTCGPAAWHHGWRRDDFDQLAGAVVAGHVIECSAQATGGNYSFFTEIDGRDDRGGLTRFGFPWADVAADGSSVIGKHDGTGGAVTVGTVTSQLLYEITGHEYLGPDVTARFDTIELERVERDRVRISGVRGQAPPSTLKVATNELGGFRNSFTVALTGLDIEEKAAFAEATFWDACPYQPDDFDSIVSRVIRTDKHDPATQEEATAVWRVTVKDRDERKVGRAFADAMVHTALAGIPGMYGLGGGPGAGTAFGVYRPAAVPSDLVPQYVHFAGRATVQIDSVAPTGSPIAPAADPPDRSASSFGSTAARPLGALVGTRSGDKGGDANLGVFVRSDDAWPWLDEFLTVDRLRELLPETAALTVERYRFPKLRSLNFVIRGLLEEGVAASTRQDAQAKAVGEWLRSRVVAIPVRLLAT
jgi:hypothetical protein